MAERISIQIQCNTIQESRAIARKLHDAAGYEVRRQHSLQV